MSEPVSESPTRTGPVTPAAATVASLLDQRGYPDQWPAGVRSYGGRTGLVAPVFTARLAPTRKGLAGELGNGTFRSLLERVPAGHVLVVSALGVAGGALIGDLMATWLAARGVAGLVTDGAVRDSEVLGGIDLAVFAACVNPGAGSPRWEIAGIDEPVVCGGVTVLPGDRVVGDADGVVVVPGTEADEVLDLTTDQELLEEFVAERLRAGDSPHGLYPPDTARRVEFENWRAKRMERR